MGSSLWASTYDYPVAVSKSDTVDDPAGEFAGLYCSVAGTVVMWVRGPAASNPVTINAVAGGYICFPVKRVGASSTATVFGLVAGIVKQGP